MKDNLTRAALWLLPFVGWLASARAAAELDVQAGVTCLRAEVLAEQLEPGIASALDDEKLGLSIRGSAHDPRTAVIHMTRDGELVAERTFSPGPTRCADLHAAVAIAIGMMVRSVVTSPPVAAPEPEPTAEPVPPALVLPPADPPPPTRPPPRFTGPARRVVKLERSIELRARGAFGLQVAGARQRGFHVEVALVRNRWSGRAGLLALFSRTDEFASVDAGYETRPLVASLDGCARLLAARSVHLDLCAGLLLGRVRMLGVANGEGRTQPPADHAWPALRGQLELALRVAGPLWLTLSLDPVHGLRTLQVEVKNTQGQTIDAPELPRTGLLLGLGLTYRIERQGSERSGHE